MLESEKYEVDTKCQAGNGSIDWCDSDHRLATESQVCTSFVSIAQMYEGSWRVGLIKRKGGDKTKCRLKPVTHESDSVDRPIIQAFI